MEQKPHKKYYYDTAHLVVLFVYTVLSILLIAISVLMSWEKWPLILVVAGVFAAWLIHIRGIIPVISRIWIYASLMMAFTFYYGAHITSAFDLSLLASLEIMVFISTGIPGIITFTQLTYYVTFVFDMYQMVSEGYHFGGLEIARSLFNIAVVTAISYIARGIIKRWNGYLEKTEEEKQALEEKTGKVNDFLANISHELRTPINAVTGLTGVCIEKEKDEEIKKYLCAVSEAGKRVGDQIGDILDHSEIDMGSLAVNEEDYALSSLITDIVSELAPDMDSAIELVIDVDPSIPSVMRSDVTKLKKIFKHLIENGLKYTREGGVYVRIMGENREYGINLLIEVRDTGIGMSDEEMEKVFDNFYQANSGRDRSASGLGLGLSIVNGFAGSLNGFLVIESEKGKGTTVRVCIPQMVINPQSIMSISKPDNLSLGAYLHFDKFKNPNVREYYNAMVRDMVLGLDVKMQRADSMEGFKRLSSNTHFTHVFVGREEYEEDPEFMKELAKDRLIAVIADDSFEDPGNPNIRVMRKPFYCFPVISFLDESPGDLEDKEEGKLYAGGVRTLVVDDEPMNLTVAKGIFGRYGMEVTTVSSGYEAIDYVRNNDTDIIFLDHMMPGMDGVEAMRRIRTELGKNRSDIPIVALTANAVSTAKEMFLKEGFDAFLAKPIEIYELERVLKKALPKSKLTFKTAPGSENEASEKTGDRFTEGLKELGIDVATGLRYSQNDEGFYRELLAQFGNDAARKRSDAERYFEDKDFNNYEILVHSIKGTARMIGAIHLSGEALSLEEAAEEKDGKKIMLIHGSAMAEYEKTAAGIMRLLSDPSNDGEEGHAQESSGDGTLEFAPDDDATEPYQDDDILEFSAESGEGK